MNTSYQDGLLDVMGDRTQHLQIEFTPEKCYVHVNGRTLLRACKMKSMRFTSTRPVPTREFCVECGGTARKLTLSSLVELQSWNDSELNRIASMEVDQTELFGDRMLVTRCT